MSDIEQKFLDEGIQRTEKLIQRIFQCDPFMLQTPLSRNRSYPKGSTDLSTTIPPPNRKAFNYDSMSEEEKNEFETWEISFTSTIITIPRLTRPLLLNLLRRTQDLYRIFLTEKQNKVKMLNGFNIIFLVEKIFHLEMELLALTTRVTAPFKVAEAIKKRKSDSPSPFLPAAPRKKARMSRITEHMTFLDGPILFP